MCGRRLLLAVGIALSANAFAFGEVGLEVVAPDPRIRHVIYHDDAGLRLDVGWYPTLIELPPGELVLDVASGGNAGPVKTWNVVWRTGRDYLFVEPRAHAKPTSLTVKTAARAYVFDLVPDVRLALFDPLRTARLVVELPLVVTPERKKELGQPGESPPPLRHNDCYSLEVVREVEAIRPSEVFDDGRFTYLRFPKNLAIPAIYRSVPGTREEQLVNAHMEGDYVVVHGLAPLWNLRLGGSVMGIFNEHYDPEAVPPLDGRTVPGTARALVEDEK